MYQIKISSFEGPLDLLLKLIEKEKFDITEVSLATITEEFLEHLKIAKEIEPEELVDFLEVMVRLLLIKSSLLLPGFEQEEEGLVERLRIYQHYFLISKKIWKIFRGKQYSFSREKIPNYLLKNFSVKIKINARSLKIAFENFLKRLPLPEEKKVLRKRVFSLKEKITELISLLDKHSSLKLDNLLISKEKIEKIFIFLAVLNLLKEKRIFLKQKKLFGEITIQKYVS